MDAPPFVPILTVSPEYGNAPFLWLATQPDTGVGGCLCDGTTYDNSFPMSEGLWGKFADWAIEFAGLVGWLYPHVVDEDKRLQVPLRVPGLPTTYFVDADGRIAGVHAGPFESTEQLATLAGREDADTLLRTLRQQMKVTVVESNL